MQIIPTQAVPSQTMAVNLNNQLCRVNVYQRRSGLYLDLYNAATTPPTLIIGGVLCEDRNRIVRSAYLGFDGDLTFYDTQGADDPDYTGLGDRFLLAYLTEGDVVTDLA